MSLLRIAYLVLALWGAAHPMYHFGIWFSENGFDGAALVAAWTANDAVTGLSIDLLIAGITLILWILAEVAVRRNWAALLAIPVTLFIGVSAGLPLYLFLRTRAA